MLFAAALTAANSFSCTQRPPPEVAADFASRRPLTVAVMPAVYLPQDAGKEHPEVKSSFYYKMMLSSLGTDNKVLRGLERHVAENLAQRGVQVVDSARVDEVLRAARINPPLYWGEVQRQLGVDSLVFINLSHWYHQGHSTYSGSPRPRSEKDRLEKKHIKVYDWSEGKDQATTPEEEKEDREVRASVARMEEFARYARESGSYSEGYYAAPHYERNAVQVVAEVSLYNAQQGDLLWRDRNFPDVISVQRVRRNPNDYVAQRAIDLAFESFPLR